MHYLKENQIIRALAFTGIWLQTKPAKNSEIPFLLDFF